jgi:DNA end-binding protein Ku
MRAIWKGAITFGLVNVPVKVYSATEDHDISLHQVHDADGGRIRYQRRCEVCDKVVDYQNIDKAYDDGSTTVVLTEDDLKSLPEERSREIEVVEFVPSNQIDPIMFDRSYFLEPDSASLKAYALLRRALEETDRTAIVQFSLRQKTRLGALRSRPSTGSGGKSAGSGGKSAGSGGKGSGSVLMLQSLLWDDEVREAKFEALKSDVKVSPQELKMASSLVKNMETDFAPDKFSDDYQEQLQKLIEAKIAEGDALDTAATFGEQPEESDSGGDVIDLMEALRQSVERNRSNRSTARDDDVKAAGSTTKATKRTASQKSSSKKAPEKKTQDKKTQDHKTRDRKKSSSKSTKKTAVKKAS